MRTEVVLHYLTYSMPSVSKDAQTPNVTSYTGQKGQDQLESLQYSTLIDASNRKIGQGLIFLNGEIKGLQSCLVIHLPVPCLVSEGARERKGGKFTWRTGLVLISSSWACFHQHAAENVNVLNCIRVQSHWYLDPASLISLIFYFLSAVKVY